jgi:hypothetical protein
MMGAQMFLSAMSARGSLQFVTFVEVICRAKLMGNIGIVNAADTLLLCVTNAEMTLRGKLQ